VKNEKVIENRIEQNRYNNRPIQYISSLHKHTNIQIFKLVGWREL
jgi:hypothetical protein